MILNCVAYENGRKLADIDVEAISDWLQRPDAFVWVALRDPTHEELRTMQEDSAVDLADELDPDDQAPARTVGKGHQGFEQVLRRGQITLELQRLALGL